MKERPILFSGPMVRAILAGTKTQTRRVVSAQPARGNDLREVLLSDRSFGIAHSAVEFGEYSPRARLMNRISCPYGVPGDRLWVRETHLLDPPIDDTWPSVGDTFASIDDIPAHYRKPEHVIYRSTCAWSTDEQARWRWRPSIFMPRWASRITLEVTAVRVERLQDISEEDAKAEGIEPRHDAKWPGGDPGYMHDVARRTFAGGWDSINGKRAPWASNPWVWVVSFKRIQL